MQAETPAPHPPAGDDSILPFQLDGADMRGRLARLDRTLEEILGQRDYPEPVAALAAEATLITALIGETMKLRWRLSLQIRGDGPVRLIATDYFAPSKDGEPAQLRAYTGYDAEATPSTSDDPFSLLGSGIYAMVVDQGAGTTPYQGLTPLTGGSLAACAETYFAQSEQIATRFALSSALSTAPGDAPRWRAGGVMIQHLPERSSGIGDGPSGEDGLMTGDDVAALGDREDDWRRATLLLATAEPHELLGPVVSPEDLLLRLFHEPCPCVFVPQPVRFGCTCSRERVEAAMAQYSAKDLTHMTNEDGKLTADCQFCGRHYEFDPATLGFEASREG
jgi:molecular chaperone Hsp33